MKGDGAPRMLRGWEAVAKRIGVAREETAIAYARLSTDPLPIVMIRGVPHAWPLYLDQWVARRNGGVMRDGTALRRLKGRKAIADHLGVRERTVNRLARAQLDPLPVYGSRRHRWTYEASVRDWQDRRTLPFQTADRQKAA